MRQILSFYNTKHPPNEGHWVSLLKYLERFGRSTLEYFDPYAHALDEPLTWNTNSVNKRLGVVAPYLSQLMNTSGHKLLQNNIQYQHDSPKIETCGRHTIYRILKTCSARAEAKRIQRSYEAFENSKSKQNIRRNC
jgi:hypothetical protein